MGVNAANMISDSVEVLGMRLVIHNTFLELDEPSSSDAFERKRARAQTEPSCVFGSCLEDNDDSNLEGCSVASTAHPESSPICRMESFATESSPRELSYSSTPRGTSDVDEARDATTGMLESNFTISNLNSCQQCCVWVLPSQLQLAPNGCFTCMPCTLSNTWMPAAGQQVGNSQDSVNMQVQKVVQRSNGHQKTTERTTLMLRNIPNDYSRDMLLELLDTHGFAARYDFAYLPIDFKRMAGLGYAFVNCVSQADAEEMMANFHGFRHWRFNSAKVCEVVWGEPLQGLQAHIDRYRNSPVMHGSVPDGCKPVMFENGERCIFPAPTKRIRAPRR